MDDHDLVERREAAAIPPHTVSLVALAATGASDGTARQGHVPHPLVRPADKDALGRPTDGELVHGLEDG
eukprot:14150673-Alexandrium_andersonii.AAC.1